MKINRVKLFVAVTVLLSIGIGGIYIFPTRYMPFISPLERSHRIAIDTCKKQILESLQDPTGAEFLDKSTRVGFGREEGWFQVIFVMRAKNAFGALRLGEVTCTAAVVGDGKSPFDDAYVLEIKASGAT